MTIGLTKRQSECFAFLRSHIAEKGIAPSFDEIGAALGLKGRSAVASLLSCIADRGYIRRLPNRARAIEIIADPDEQAITLNPEIARLVRSYAEQEGIKVDTACNALLRDALGATA